MRRFAILLSAVAASLAACSGTTTAETTTTMLPTTAPAPAATTTGITTTTLTPFVSAYPDLAYEVREIPGDGRPFYTPPRRAEPDTSAVVEIGYEAGFFSPAFVELTGPQLILFTNNTADPVTIAFADEVVDEFTLEPGAEHTVDVAALPPDVYRFHTYVGASKIPGSIDTKALGVPVDTGSQLVQQSSFSGRLIADVTYLGRWDVHAQSDGLVAVPGTTRLNESFLRSVVWGDPLLESGLSMQLVDDADVDELLGTVSPPSGCERAGSGPATRAGMTGAEHVYACTIGEVRYGVVTSDGTALVYTLAEVPAGSAPDLHAILDSVRIEPPGTGMPRHGLAEAGPDLFSSSAPGPWSVEIVDATLGPHQAVAIAAGNSTQVEVGNYDEVGHIVYGADGPLVELPPRTAVTLDLLDLAGGASSAHFILGDSPFGKLSIVFDLSGLGPLPPLDTYSDPTTPELALVETRFDGASEVVLQTIDIPSWERTGELWVRNASPDDVTSLEQRFEFITYVTYDTAIAEVSAELHKTPDRAETLGLLGSGVWRAVFWEFDDRPSTAAAYLVVDDAVYAQIVLVAAPEEFDLFVEKLFWPAVDSFRVTIEE